MLSCYSGSVSSFFDILKKRENVIWKMVLDALHFKFSILLINRFEIALNFAKQVLVSKLLGYTYCNVE